MNALNKERVYGGSFIIKKIFYGENGQALVLFALLFILLIGFTGEAIDGGRLYIAKFELQKVVDAGALAGDDALVNDYLRPNRVSTQKLNQQ